MGNYTYNRSYTKWTRTVAWSLPKQNIALTTRVLYWNKKKKKEEKITWPNQIYHQFKTCEKWWRFTFISRQMWLTKDNAIIELVCWLYGLEHLLKIASKDICHNTPLSMQREITHKHTQCKHETFITLCVPNNGEWLYHFMICHYKYFANASVFFFRMSKSIFEFLSSFDLKP